MNLETIDQMKPGTDMDIAVCEALGYQVTWWSLHIGPDYQNEVLLPDADGDMPMPHFYECDGDNFKWSLVPRYSEFYDRAMELIKYLSEMGVWVNFGYGPEQNEQGDPCWWANATTSHWTVYGNTLAEVICKVFLVSQMEDD